MCTTGALPPKVLHGFVGGLIAGYSLVRGSNHAIWQLRKNQEIFRFVSMFYDFVQPFKLNKTYSIGVFLLKFVNMSPLVRNKPENILPLGFIDGPKKPKGETMKSIFSHFFGQIRKLGLEPKRYECSAVLDHVFSRVFLTQIDSDRPAENELGCFRGAVYVLPFIILFL